MRLRSCECIYERYDPVNINTFWDRECNWFRVLKSSYALFLTLFCFWSLPGEEMGRCFTIEYLMPMSVQLTSESTVSVLSKRLLSFCTTSFWMSGNLSEDFILGLIICAKCVLILFYCGIHSIGFYLLLTKRFALWFLWHRHWSKTTPRCRIIWDWSI